MERLTGRRDGRTYIVGCPDFALPKIAGLIIQQTVDRLAAYEETGLEPGDIKRVFNEDAVFFLAGQALGVTLARLRELAQADREGRCVVLPAKTVFELTWDAGPGCDMICPVSIDGEGQCDFCDNGKLFVYERPCRQEHIDRIGKDVFLTREEAEAALRREQDG